MSDTSLGRSARDRLRRESALGRNERPGSLIQILTSAPGFTEKLPRSGSSGGIAQKLVQAPAPTHVHRLGPVLAAGPMITPQDVTRLVAPRPSPDPGPRA